MSTEAWKLEKDLCRCCHAEGSFHNLAEPRYKLGQQEIYIEMLRQCLDINLSPVSGLLCSMTFTICDSCVQRLRDASNFKKQVQLCEERFKDMYSNVMKALNPGLTTSYEVKLEEIPVTLDEGIKEEYLNMSDDDDGFDVVMDDDDDDDDKTVLQVKLDNAKKAKAKPKPAPKSKAKKLPQKKTVTPRKKAEKTETAAKSEDKPKKGRSPTIPYTLTKADDGTDNFACDICGRVFKKRRNFAQHYNQVHLKKRPKPRTCHRCDVKVPGYLRAAHMEAVHGVPAPECLTCNRKFAYPHQVIKHQKIHLKGEKDFECKSPTIPYTLIKADDGTDSFACDICGRVFKKRKNFAQHYQHVHLKKRPKRRACHRCDVKVPTYLRAAHMEAVHGVPAPKCLACNRKFAYPHQVIKHQKTDHMGEKNFECKICHMKFSFLGRLSRHMVKHTQTRKFICDLCGKSFRWKNNLRNHMYIHLNIRRYVCPVCCEAFVQCTSLSYHMKKHHPDIPDLV